MTPLEIYLHIFNWRYVTKLQENDSSVFPTFQQKLRVCRTCVVHRMLQYCSRTCVNSVRPHNS